MALYTKTFAVTPGNRVGSQRLEDEFDHVADCNNICFRTLRERIENRLKKDAPTV